MNRTAFFASVKAGDIAPCYLLYGQELLVLDSAVKALRARVLPQGLETLNETVLRAPTAAQIITSCETLPLMGDRRLVLVEDCPLLVAGRSRDEAGESERLIAYLSDLPPFACLVFVVQGAVDGRKKLTVALQKQATAVSFDPLGDAELTKWIQGRFKKAGKEISPRFCGILTFTSGRDLTQLSGEIEKLVAYMGERTQLEGGDIDAVATRTAECTIFQLVDAIVARQERQAFSLLQYMLERGESRLGILAMLLRQLRQLYFIHSLQEEGLPRDAQQKLLGMPGFAFTRAQGQMRGFTERQLQENMQFCIETDYAVKSGKLREEFSLDRVILGLCSQQRTGKAG